MVALTSAQEHYMMAISALSSGGGGARICDVAEKIGVTKPSVCAAVKVLEQMKLVRRDENRLIILTPKGETQAHFIMSKLDIVRRYLIKDLGIGEDAAEVDASAIEHLLSNETLCSMCRQTGKDICTDDCYLKIEKEIKNASKK